MRSVMCLLTVLAVMALAFWAYRENYRTQTALGEMSKVQREIAGLREELGVLRAEWAFLNRPARLRELANMTFDKLKLVPLGPDQFVEVRQIAYPLPKPEAAPSEDDLLLAAGANPLASAATAALVSANPSAISAVLKPVPRPSRQP